MGGAWSELGLEILDGVGQDTSWWGAGGTGLGCGEVEQGGS